MNGILTYPSTPSGGNVTIDCPPGQFGYQTRYCNSSQWESPIIFCQNGPSPVNNLIIKDSTPSSIRLSWSSSIGSTKYRILISQFQRDYYIASLGKGDNVTETEFQVGSLQPNSKFYFKVLSGNSVFYETVGSNTIGSTQLPRKFCIYVWLIYIL